MIPQGEGWDKVEEIQSLFPDIDTKFCAERFLASPYAINWHLFFNFKDDELGFIKSQFGQRLVDRHPVINLEIGVRGKPADIKNWFEDAREWIVLAFEDVTSSQVQEQVWRKIRDA